ncbi:hypothetical protein LINGRAHAP2_LOCUS24001, partial [Linum grandiflorum]
MWMSMRKVHYLSLNIWVVAKEMEDAGHSRGARRRITRIPQ